MDISITDKSTASTFAADSSTTDIFAVDIPIADIYVTIIMNGNNLYYQKSENKFKYEMKNNYL